MFLETICILHGEIQHRKGHEERMRQTAAHFGLKVPDLPDLTSLLPDELRDGKVKCRIIYDDTIKDISFEPYLPKKISSLQLVEGAVDYSFKFVDREALNSLLKKKGDCDEILITRNGLITDTSYSNVVFSQGKEYFTPESRLLNGTKRQKLLQEGKITERRIDRDSLHEYDRIYLINAMLDIEDEIYLPVGNII